MSHSSNTTLISPTTTVTAGSHTQNGSMPPPPVRRTSHGPHHHTVHHHAHTTKRRQGSSTHLHNGHHGTNVHAAPHAGSSSNRRSSEGEHGRRAMAAGLTMASMEPGKPKRKGSGDRPKKASRSDASLNTLSRVNSRHSNSSNSRNNSRHSSRANSPTRPTTNTRQRSDTSVHSVELDAAGNPTAEVDSGEEGWEDEGKKSRQETPKPADGLRRTKSDTHAEPQMAAEAGPSKSVPPITRKTTGFAGPTLPPDPMITTYAHALNDPTHIMPAHQIKHQQSARSLHAIQAQAQNAESETRTPSLGRRSDTARRSMPGMSRTSSRSSVKRVESPGVAPEVQRVESGLSMTKTAGETPPIREVSPAERLASDQSVTPSDILGKTARLSTSPSYPFPRAAPDITTAPLSESPSTMTAPPPPECPEHVEALPRSRQISGTSQQPRTLRHRYSNSSIRSIQSLRAPPHPLNSPTGYRTGIHPAASTHNSPRRTKGPSMHHPPIAPPVVSSDVANGMQWNELPDRDSDPRAPSPPTSVYRSRTGHAERTSSFSSSRSAATLTGSVATSSRPQTNRRPTAFEATAKASRLRSTADPAAYHASLGLSPATADTAHLISRFLPPPKATRPSWEITPAQAHAGHVGVGLTNGDYRESHEALVRTMMSMGVSEKPALTVNGRAASYIGRNDVGGGIITPRQPAMSISSIDEVVGVGMVKGPRGGLVVGRGGWEGKSPFLLSVDRCLAQKPVRGVPGI